MNLMKLMKIYPFIKIIPQFDTNFLNSVKGFLGEIQNESTARDFNWFFVCGGLTYDSRLT